MSGDHRGQQRTVSPGTKVTDDSKTKCGCMCAGVGAGVRVHVCECMSEGACVWVRVWVHCNLQGTHCVIHSLVPCLLMKLALLLDSGTLWVR